MMGAVWQDGREDGMASTHFYPPPNPEKGSPPIIVSKVHAFYLQTRNGPLLYHTLKRIACDKMYNITHKILRNSITIWTYSSLSLIIPSF